MVLSQVVTEGPRIGATTAEKLEGTSTGVDTDPLLFLLHHSPPHYCSAHVFIHRLPRSSFPSLRVQYSQKDWGNLLSCPRCPAKKTTVNSKSLRRPNTLGPQFVQSWRGRVPRVAQGVCAYRPPTGAKPTCKRGAGSGFPESRTSR